jgi:hypothetical protein
VPHLSDREQLLVYRPGIHHSASPCCCNLRLPRKGHSTSCRRKMEHSIAMARWNAKHCGTKRMNSDGVSLSIILSGCKSTVPGLIRRISRRLRSCGAMMSKLSRSSLYLFLCYANYQFHLLAELQSMRQLASTCFVSLRQLVFTDWHQHHFLRQLPSYLFFYWLVLNGRLVAHPIQPCRARAMWIIQDVAVLHSVLLPPV